LIETTGQHTKRYEVIGQQDGNPMIELPNIFYVTKYSDVDTITYYFSSDPKISKIYYKDFDEQHSFIENIAQWLWSTRGYLHIPRAPPISKQPSQDVLDFGYYHMTHINPYTSRFYK